MMGLEPPRIRVSIVLVNTDIKIRQKGQVVESKCREAQQTSPVKTIISILQKISERKAGRYEKLRDGTCPC